MKKNILIPLLIFATHLSAQDEISKARWQAKEIIVDGENNEWQKPFNLYDGSTGLLFSIANDSTNLFLCFTANDETKARKIMHTGWQIELSSKEKNKKFSSFIIFPVRQMADFENKGTGNNKFDWRKRSDFAGLVNSYKMQFATITCSGFKTKNGVLPVMDSTGIKVSIADDSVQGVVYELAIPLHELFEKKLIQLNEQITLNVNINGLETQSSGSGNHAGWGGEGAGRSEGGQGRMGGTNGMNGMNGANRMTGGERAGEEFSDENENRNSGERGVMFERASLKQKFRLTGN